MALRQEKFQELTTPEFIFATAADEKKRKEPVTYSNTIFCEYELLLVGKL